MPRSDPGELSLALAERFFAAIEAGDVAAVEALYHPALRVWHSNDRLETDVATNLVTLRRFVGRTRFRRYEDRRIEATVAGFVQQHRLIAETMGGMTLDTPVCIVVAIEDSLIVRIDEYVDARDLAPWFAATA